MSQKAEDIPASTGLAPSERGGIISVLMNQAFLRLWMAQALSQTSQQMINYNLLIQVRRIIAVKRDMPIGIGCMQSIHFSQDNSLDHIEALPAAYIEIMFRF